MVTSARKDYLDKVSTDLIKNHDVIVLEDLFLFGFVTSFTASSIVIGGLESVARLVITKERRMVRVNG